jgi:HAD superfamily hydrolase (TIGR01457 family)
LRFSGFMIDMDGTIYKGSNVIPGAVDFVDNLRKNNIPFVFLTNNSSCPRSYYHRKLERMGFKVSEEEVITSNVATMRFVLENYPESKVFPIASDEVIKEISDAGINVTDKDPDIVYLTFDKSIDYEKINNGFHHILNGAQLIATHPDDVCPTEDSYDVDIGPFIRLFESLSGCKAKIIGKPNRLMLEMASIEMGIKPDNAVMVGDRLYTDIKMASNAGIRSILVLSGETSRKDLESSDITPTFILDSVADIPRFINED